ncbi:MFS transporter [soil metagenome]
MPTDRVQWRALIAAVLGWGFDGLDSYLFIAVAQPLVRQLLVGRVAPEDLGAAVLERGAWIQAAFFVGWALGGWVFGRLGDRIGRTRVLCLTILTYALFTGMGFFATEWWHLLIFRFIAALGIGGEWAAGSALVSETLPARHRAWASALLQTGYIAGILAATLAAGFFKAHDPRWVFLVGVVPALLVLYIRAGVPEPEAWHAARTGHALPRWGALFAPGVARVTLSIGAFVSVMLVVVWVFIFFMGAVLRLVPAVAALPAAEQQQEVASCALAYFSVNIVANFAATYAARLLGARRAFFLFVLGAAAAVLLGFARQPATLLHAYLAASATAFFGLGLFAIFPLYIPPQFPTLLRTLGAGLTYNVGRLATAAGTLVAGTLAARAGGPSNAIWFTGLLLIPALALCCVLPRERSVALE